MANLFKSDIDEVKKYLAIPITNQFETIEGYLQDAMDTFIVDKLSADMLTKLQADVTANSTDADHLALLHLVKKAQANFAYLLYASDGTIIITDSGFLQMEESGQKSAYQWQVREFKEARKSRGWHSLNQMLTLLMRKRDVYTQFSNSPEYQELTSTMLVTLSEANKIRQMADMETLWAIRPAMHQVIDDVIKSNTTDALFSSLLTKYKGTTALSSQESSAISKIQKALLHTALHVGSLEINFELTANGLRVPGYQHTGPNSNTNLPADRQDYFNLREDAKKKGQAAVKELRKYLDATSSAAIFSEYFSSDLYNKQSSQTFTNKPGGSFWGV